MGPSIILNRDQIGQGILAHEYGHAVWRALGGDTPGSMLPVLFSTSPSYPGGAPSMYAAGNMGENFAESFGLVVRDPKTASQLARQSPRFAAQMNAILGGIRWLNP